MMGCTNIRDIIQSFLGHSPLDTTAINDHSDALCFHQFAYRVSSEEFRDSDTISSEREGRTLSAETTKHPP